MPHRVSDAVCACAHTLGYDTIDLIAAWIGLHATNKGIWRRHCTPSAEAIETYLWCVNSHVTSVRSLLALHWQLAVSYRCALCNWIMSETMEENEWNVGKTKEKERKKSNTSEISWYTLPRSEWTINFLSVTRFSSPSTMTLSFQTSHNLMQK